MLRTGLALSGGGLRATLYHLGVVRYLRDASLLDSVTHITSVSGGSVLGAHLVLNWDRYNGDEKDFEAAAQEILDFVRLDVRNRIIRRYPFAWTASFLQRIARQRPSSLLTRTGLLEAHYRDFLFGDTCLHQLPVRPELHVLCTNLSEGRLSSFTRSGLLLEERSRTGGVRMRCHRGGLATVPMAVAASSAFPGFFPPLELTADDIGATNGEFQTQYFTDGGVYDNLGIRMFRYLEQRQRSSFTHDEFPEVETAVRAWNNAAQSQSPTALQRIAQLALDVSERRHDGLKSVSYVHDSSELIARLDRLIDEADLSEDKQLQALLANRPASDDFATETCPSGSSSLGQDSALSGKNDDSVAKNRQLIAAAFHDATGQSCLRNLKVGFDAIIASDAGKKFQVTRPDRAGSFLRTAMRSSDILMDRVWQLEKEHFAESTDYVFVPITRVVSLEEDSTALHPEVQVQVSNIRTDMDRFDDREIRGLVAHGYSVARQSIQSRPCLATYTHSGPPWSLITPPESATAESHSDDGWRGASAATATALARRLQNSSRRRYLGVALSPRDWVTYLYLPLLILLLGVIPWFTYRAWRHSRVATTLTSAMSDSRQDFRTLLDLMEYGPIEPWRGMPYVDADHLDPLFAEQGLDIITDTKITDLRALSEEYQLELLGAQPRVYVYRQVSVRKNMHSDGETGLRLHSLWDMPVIDVRCHNTDLKPELRRFKLDSGDESQDGITYAWQLKLDFRNVPVGHTTDVIVEAVLPAERAALGECTKPWWDFEVDADPEVAVSWLLLPDEWSRADPRLIRYENGVPDSLDVVEPTRKVSIMGDSILNWTVVHPRAGYTYSYHWNSRQVPIRSSNVRNAQTQLPTRR